MAGPIADSGPHSIAGMAEIEAEKRANATRAADAATIEARELAAKGEVAIALDKLAAARASLPQSPMTLATRAAARDTFSEIATEEAGRLASAGSYPEAKTLLDRVLAVDMDPDNRPAKRLLAEIQDPVRYPPANSPELAANRKEVLRLLTLAESHYNLGRFDEARATYEEVLRIDRYNVAAREGMEKVEGAIIEYAGAAYNHSRARMLRQVDQGWTSENPEANAAAVRATVAQAQGQVTEVAARDAIGKKLREIQIDNIALEGVDIRDALQTVVSKARMLDRGAKEGEARGVSVILRIGSLDEPFAQQVINREINLRLTDVPLEAVLRYLAEQAGLAVVVEPFAVVLVPPASANASLYTRTYDVPPDFISNVPTQAGGDAGDPFGNPGGGGLALQRLSAKTFLEQTGLTFPEGASANFDPRTSTVTMRSSQANHEMLEGMIEAARSNINPQVTIEAKMLEVNELTARELGFDWLLGAFTGSNGVAVAGGTGPGMLAPNTYPFNYPGGGPVGSNPVTAGNRSGDTAFTGRNLDRLLDVQDASKLAQGVLRAPGILSIAGALSEPNFQVVIRAISQAKGTDFLNAPTVTTRSGLPARIEVIRDFIYPTEFDPPELPNSVGNDALGGGGGGGLLSPATVTTFPVTPANPAAFDSKPVGSILEVDPVVSADKKLVEVNMDITHREFIGFVNYGTPITSGAIDGLGRPTSIIITENRIIQPIFETRHLKTSTSVYDGQTIFVGGMLGEQSETINDKVPILGDAPILGRLFKSNARKSSRKALMIFLTVRVLDPSGRPLNASSVNAASISP
ncbi:MAG: Amuc_1098 family type IV pilus outer membrane protein [Verrucomicrobiales bacterium]